MISINYAALASGAKDDEEKQQIEDNAPHMNAMFREYQSRMGSVASSVDFITEKDTDDYLRIGIGDDNAWLKDQSADDQLKAVEQFGEFVDRFIEDAYDYKFRLETTINWGYGEGVIGKKFERAMRTRKGDLGSVKKFFETTLPKLAEGWRKQIKEMNTLRDELGVTEKEIPLLGLLKGGQAKNEESAVVPRVIAELKKYKKLRQNPKESPRGILMKRAHGRLKKMEDDGVIYSANRWMNWIEKQDPTDKQFEKFLGSGGRLDQLEKNWRSVAGDFLTVQARMQKEGVPQGTHRKSKLDFLKMKYDQRKKYVQRTSALLDLAKPEHELVDKLQGMIHRNEWDAAENLIKYTSFTGYVLADKWRFAKLSAEVHKHQEEDEQGGEKDKNVAELFKKRQQMLDEIASLPEPMRTLYKRAHRIGRLRTVMAGHRNIEWAREHGFLHRDNLAQMRETCTANTEKIIQEGKGKKKRGITNCDADANVKGTNSRFRYPSMHGVWGPEYVHYSASGVDNVLNDAADASHAHKYWILYMPKGVDLNTVTQIHKTKHWTMKKGLAAEQELLGRGISMNSMLSADAASNN